MQPTKIRTYTLGYMFIGVTVFTAIFTWMTIATTTYSSSYMSTEKCFYRGGQCKPSMLSKHRLYPSNETLIDLKYFRYHINNHICKVGDIFLVVIVHSAPVHFHERDVIRETWGRVTVGHRVVKTVFLLAEVEDRNIQRLIEMENEENRDIVQGSFIDAYHNLTYKHVMGLRWVTTYCAQAQFVLKVDDDIYVEIYQLLELLDHRYPEHSNGSRLGNALACYIQNKMPVVRDQVSKWYVSKEEYSDDNFENYCSGWAYVMSTSAAAKLERVSHDYSYFWVDDVHVTGTLAKAAGVIHRRLNEWFTIETQGLVEWTRSSQKLLWKYVFGPTWGDMELMTEAHIKAAECRKQNCRCCFKPPQPKLPENKPAVVVKRQGIVRPIPIAVG